MQVGGLGGAAASWLNSLGKIGGEAPADPFAPARAGQNDQAKPAASNTSFPTSSPVALSADGLLALQQADDAEPLEPSAADQFLELMKKSPEERLRDSILKSLGITEEDLQSMPPEQRKTMEDMIAKMIKERITPVEGETNLNSLSPDQVVRQLKASNQYLATDLMA
ncbi:MAG: hypothetical protein QM773_06100 [Hyphomonadaceae bacterium]